LGKFSLEKIFSIFGFGLYGVEYQAMLIDEKNVVKITVILDVVFIQFQGLF
jgi:hypothetical protein